MNKKDFRVRVPLWNIAIFAALAFWAYGGVYAVDMMWNGIEVTVENGEASVLWNMPALAAAFGGMALLLIVVTAYFIQVIRHNRRNPEKKLGAIYFFKPVELLEDDEMVSQITNRAAKKVYAFYTSLLPLLVLLMLFPLPRYTFILIVCLGIMAHNAIIYREMRRFVS
ncbi:hypothetical protein [Alteribacter natronophilus]|uniref:hypothetical protein n=1 Tax=Alteribacter natronophilus TaxID=2583810 RepID=UPI00110F1E21|nr:hypothetical protein [Alteribacter natronophilus]TMW70980.1 hypothetical protein FGB90_13480 [Alteribacter natronophilus]